MSTEKWLLEMATEIAKEGHCGWANTCQQAADDFAALTAERDQWERRAGQYMDERDLLAKNVLRDAARYRWLRKIADMNVGACPICCYDGLDFTPGTELDASIDAALQEKRDA
jgi:hypothetical protein